jgi:hypothetical protein
MPQRPLANSGDGRANSRGVRRRTPHHPGSTSNDTAAALQAVLPLAIAGNDEGVLLPMSSGRCGSQILKDVAGAASSGKEREIRPWEPS